MQQFVAIKPFTFAGTRYERGQVFDSPQCDADKHKRLFDTRYIGVASHFEALNKKRGRPRKAK